MEQKSLKYWERLTEVIKEEFGTNLIQIATYNNHTSKGNMIVISELSNYSKLTNLNKFLKKNSKFKMPMPLFFTREYVNSSLDSFPLEFINIRKDYKNLICTDDVLSKIYFKKKDVRLAVERELKGKWIHIQSNFLEYFQAKKSLLKLMDVSLTGIIPILEGFLFIKDFTVPEKPIDIIQLCDEETKFSIATFKKVFELISMKKKISLFELQEMFKDYLFEIEELIKHIDTIN